MYVRLRYYTGPMDDSVDHGLLTLSQAAAEFGVTHSRLRMAAWQGRLPSIKPGHDYLVRRQDVVAFLATSRRGRPTKRSQNPGGGTCQPG